VVFEVATFAVFEFEKPALLETLTQYDELLTRLGVVKELEVAPEIGLPVVPDKPLYHW